MRLLFWRKPKREEPTRERRGLITEGLLAEAIADFRDAQGLPLKVSKVVVSSGPNELLANRMLSPAEFPPGVKPSMVVEVDPYMPLDSWRLA